MSTWFSVTKSTESAVTATPIFTTAGYGNARTTNGCYSEEENRRNQPQGKDRGNDRACIRLPFGNTLHQNNVQTEVDDHAEELQVRLDRRVVAEPLLVEIPGDQSDDNQAEDGAYDLADHLNERVVRDATGK
jgi:hypothetical protein